METGSGEGKTRPEEVAAYIAAMTAEMGRLARKHNLPALGYLLEVARVEAMERAAEDAPDGSQRIA
ncbi:MAG: hypothetical protein KF826_08090 [Xanthobacteraceae bacterium]|nr:hypothetical protein [Xanthobacteraceae bacterium]MBX3523663.1 hypothetical protein [Xanthobacteraceae bacterium]MBX3534297.1 hypothetical protein [Xanthobacteraceae bacterium]MBX3550471.1 hypothetical protein [Xanthobacteraceae bacterium]MCW5676110.1 hypothetical protein [Xanthobacteraceae bacterium]